MKTSYVRLFDLLKLDCVRLTFNRYGRQAKNMYKKQMYKKKKETR